MTLFSGTKQQKLTRSRINAEAQKSKKKRFDAKPRLDRGTKHELAGPANFEHQIIPNNTLFHWCPFGVFGDDCGINRFRCRLFCGWLEVPADWLWVNGSLANRSRKTG
jgi:hypothetical protein